MVRAVHLEIVTELSTEQVLLAMRRFVARRGKPNLMISDNAKAFKLAKRFLTRWDSILTDPSFQDYFSNAQIEWKFIVEYASWMGGFYERMVGTVKRALKKAVRYSKLTLIQLQTVIVEVEAVVNSRPLIYVSSEISDRVTLTPADFLSSNSKLGFLNVDEMEVPEIGSNESTEAKLLNGWIKGQKLLKRFWDSWRNEYLLSLRERSNNIKKCKSEKGEPKVDDVILVKEQLPRSRWKIGRIIDLVPSSDGICRSARVLLPNKKCVQRSIKHLIPLETSDFNFKIGEKQEYEEKKLVSNAKIEAKEKIQNMLK